MSASFAMKAYSGCMKKAMFVLAGICIFTEIEVQIGLSNPKNKSIKIMERYNNESNKLTR